jgi:hypothetical protein
MLIYLGMEFGADSFRKINNILCTFNKKVHAVVQMVTS